MGANPTGSGWLVYCANISKTALTFAFTISRITIQPYVAGRDLRSLKPNCHSVLHLFFAFYFLTITLHMVCILCLVMQWNFGVRYLRHRLISFFYFSIYSCPLHSLVTDINTVVSDTVRYLWNTRQIR